MALSKLRYQLLKEEMERKNKLQQTNWFVKNIEDAYENPYVPKVNAAKTRRFLNEVREMQAEIKEIYSDLEKYQMEINVKKHHKSDVNKSLPRLDTDISYMYPVPPDVQQQLYTGTYSPGVNTRGGMGSIPPPTKPKKIPQKSGPNHLLLDTCFYGCL